MNLVEESYRYCESVTKKHAKSFYFAAKFLPKKKQKQIYALYALCRHIDDEIDKAKVSDKERAKQEVNKWRDELERLYSQNQVESDKSRELVLIAWKNLNQHSVPLSLILELVEGVLMDTYINRYSTFQELYVYCYRVASTVGLMSSEIFGYKRKEALIYAEAMGIAMQMTNILRDVGEDASMNRIYLPREDLLRFGVSEEQILKHQLSDNFIELMKFEIKRTRDFYREAEKGIPLLEKDVRFTVLIASKIYEKILDKIEEQNYDVFRKRAHTNLAQKIVSLPKIWIESKRLIAK
jgi:phytoene synthase